MSTQVNINVAQQLKEPVGSTRSYRFEEVGQPLDEGAEYDYKGEATFLRTDKGILVTATFESTLSGTCSRCLAPVRYGVTASLQEEFYPTIDILTGLPVSAPSPDSFRISQDHSLDLSEAFRQYTVTHISMKLLCKPTCAGLCLQCGVNLNEVSCDCPKEALDSRWAALRDFPRGT